MSRLRLLQSLPSSFLVERLTPLDLHLPKGFGEISHFPLESLSNLLLLMGLALPHHGIFFYLLTEAIDFGVRAKL